MCSAFLQHPLVTYPYQSVITFGGCKEDFMLVVSQIKDQALGKKTVDKLVFAMAKPKVRPANSQKVKHSLTTFPNEASKDGILILALHFTTYLKNLIWSVWGWNQHFKTAWVEPLHPPLKPLSERHPMIKTGFSMRVLLIQHYTIQEVLMSSYICGFLVSFWLDKVRAS